MDVPARRRFAVELVGTRIQYYIDPERGYCCMVNVPALMGALIRRLPPEAIVEFEACILDSAEWYAERPDGDCGDLFVALEHCQPIVGELLGERAAKDLEAWVSGAEEEIDAAEAEEHARKTSKKDKRKSRAVNANWQALVTNRHRKRRKAKDPDYVPPSREKGKEEEEEEEDGLDALIGAMSDEEEEKEEKEEAMTWEARKDFVLFSLGVAKELRKQWVTFKEDDPQLAGVAASLLNNTMRAIAPHWPMHPAAPVKADPPVTISERLVLLGHRPENLEDAHFRAIGIEAARLYEHEYGTRPEITRRRRKPADGGAWHSVNKYRRSMAHKTIDRAIRRVLD